MKSHKTILLAAFVFLIIVLNSMLFTVNQTEYAVVTQFGRPVRAITQPGLNWKLPDPIQNIQRYDNRLKVYTPRVAEFLTRDKKNVMVESFTIWRIQDPVIFMKTLKTFSTAQERLNDVVFSELGVSLGRYDLDDLVNVAEDSLELPEMMVQMQEIADRKLSDYGIQVTDVRVKVLNFPEKNKQSVFQRMRAEREKMARLYRSQGTEESSKIRATADKEKTLILSAAYEKAEKIKGEGDAQAIKIYANAFQKDAEFYEFTRSLQAYEKL
ncbi:MAG: protease modulator HflC, partial [Actinobacteria bacterium]|nr:protease modulator HflC [Actinomycetota bacterium]